MSNLSKGGTVQQEGNELPHNLKKRGTDRRRRKRDFLKKLSERCQS